MEDDKPISVMNRLRLKRQLLQKQKQKGTELEAQLEPEHREPTLKERLADLNDKLTKLGIISDKDSKLKKKSFKVSGKVKAQIRKGARKNKIQVILLKENKGILATIGEFKAGQLIVGDKAYDATADITWLWNGKIPTAIACEWDLRPITKNRLMRNTKTDESFSHPQVTIIRAIENRELESKKKLGGKALIWIIIGGIVIAYLIFGGGGG